MENLKRRFDAARAAIGRPEDRTYHYPLLEISRAVNSDGGTDFNRKGLAAHGINPEEFRAAWAEGYACETLALNSNQPIYAAIILSRCRTCLDEDGPLAFGTVLDDEIKQRVRWHHDALAARHG